MDSFQSKSFPEAYSISSIFFNFPNTTPQGTNVNVDGQYIFKNILDIYFDLLSQYHITILLVITLCVYVPLSVRLLEETPVH